MKKIFSLFYVLLLPLFLLAQEAVTVTVLGDRVNLRNGATEESDVVGQANYGQKLKALSIQEKWVEVHPPADFAAWVYSPLLFEDREVRAPELNVRSGPGTQFIILGQLKRGDKVSVVENREDWRKIEVPEVVTLWISREFVKIPDSALTEKPEKAVPPVVEPTPVPTAVPTPVPTPVTIVKIQTVEKIVEVPVTPTPLPKVEPPPGLDLVPLKGQGTASRRRGVVHAYLLAGSSPSRFVLIRKGGSGDTLCYLIGNEEVLKSLSGKTVTVTGHDFWVTGQRLPATKIGKIEKTAESR